MKGMPPIAPAATAARSPPSWKPCGHNQHCKRHRHRRTARTPIASATLLEFHGGRLWRTLPTFSVEMLMYTCLLGCCGERWRLHTARKLRMMRSSPGSGPAAWSASVYSKFSGPVGQRSASEPKGCRQRLSLPRRQLLSSCCCMQQRSTSAGAVIGTCPSVAECMPAAC
jgi:hypothetical protein